MKKLILYSVIALNIVSCNIPKDGEQENIATSKLEVLTNLGNEDSTKAVKDTLAHSEAH